VATVADVSLRALTFSRALASRDDRSAAAALTTIAPQSVPVPRSVPVPSGVSQAGSLAAVVFADMAEVPVAELGAYGVTDVYVVTSDCYAPRAWARTLAGLAGTSTESCVEAVAETTASTRDHEISAVIAAGTDHGNEVLAHLGAITGLPMAANCVSASATDGGGLDLVRQRWAGLLLEEATLDAPVALLTVATDAVSPLPATKMPEVAAVAAVPEVPEVAAVPAVPAVPETAGAAEVAEVAETAGVTVHLVAAATEDDELVIRAEEEPAGTGGASLATARVVVGGGRGVGSADGFASLEELAGLLGGVVGVSRVVTSEGWRPHTQQVGQTGTKITPDLYLACGISGAIQHIAGCSGARHIIAINTDPSAPMMSRADYAVVGDLHQVIPALVAALRDR
jgi:electron transfer flavoprotein alpha subunit